MFTKIFGSHNVPAVVLKCFNSIQLLCDIVLIEMDLLCRVECALLSLSTQKGIHFFRYGRVPAGLAPLPETSPPAPVVAVFKIYLSGANTNRAVFCDWLNQHSRTIPVLPLKYS